MSAVSLDYYYGAEADTYSFYRIPKTLFSDPGYSGMSCEAKVLYGLMLDRMSLSVKNRWLDGENRVFIYFTLEDVQEYMNCQRDKAMKLLAELDSVKGAGLIERVRQGQGRPSIIYVKKLIGGADLLKSEKPTSGQPDMPTSGVRKTPPSARRKNRPLDVGETDANKTEYIKTDLNDTDQSINPAGMLKTRGGEAAYPADRINGYRELLAENIEYELLCDTHGAERMVGVLDILTETVCSGRKTIRVGGEDLPAEVVKSRLLKLDNSHVDYVFECLDANTTKIQNIRAYLLTALYRAPTTVEPYYCAEVRHDLRGGDKTDVKLQRV